MIKKQLLYDYYFINIRHKFANIKIKHILAKAANLCFKSQNAESTGVLEYFGGTYRT